jgi:hypothetical protein
MKQLRKLIAGSALVASSLLLLLLPQFAVSHTQQMSGMQHGTGANSDEPVPAYHPQPPTDELPPTMQPAIFKNVAVANAYAVAARVKKVLYQEPCYCHCDRSQGHGSLLDCFVSRHGSGCEICMREAFYSYEQTQKGKTPTQIRGGLIHGEWQAVDVAKYKKAPLSDSASPAN